MSIGGVIDAASVCVAALGIIAGAAALAATRRRLLALSVLLDLLMAAGLLHLAADPNYTRAASAAIVLFIRRLITWSLAKDTVVRRQQSWNRSPGN